MLPAALLLALVTTAFPQLVVVNDPTVGSKHAEMTSAERKIFERDALPAVRSAVPAEQCTEDLEDAGVARGAFTEPGKRQSLIFYQFCQTGNGFGINGLVLIEGDSVVGNSISDGSWGLDIAAVPDINRNGILEFTLAYSGGLHQGAGGIGVDIMEFSDGLPTAIGWYRAEEIGPSGPVTMWKLTAQPGKSPLFYKQKFISGKNDNARPVGKNVRIELGQTFVSKFERVK